LSAGGGPVRRSTEPAKSWHVRLRRQIPPLSRKNGFNAAQREWKPTIHHRIRHAAQRTML